MQLWYLSLFSFTTKLSNGLFKCLSGAQLFSISRKWELIPWTFLNFFKFFFTCYMSKFTSISSTITKMIREVFCCLHEVEDRIFSQNMFTFQVTVLAIYHVFQFPLCVTWFSSFFLECLIISWHGWFSSRKMISRL